MEIVKVFPYINGKVRSTIFKNDACFSLWMVHILKIN